MDNQEKTPAPACPECGAIDNVVPLVYGRPGPELQKRAEKGEVHLGGCLMEYFNWFCKECDKKFEDAQNK